MNQSERAIQRGHLEVGRTHCNRCGKVVFRSESEARNALQKLVALRLMEYGQIAEAELYKCHPRFNPDVYHLTSQKHGHVDQALKDKRALKIWEDGFDHR